MTSPVWQGVGVCVMALGVVAPVLLLVWETADAGSPRALLVSSAMRIGAVALGIWGFVGGAPFTLAEAKVKVVVVGLILLNQAADTVDMWIHGAGRRTGNTVLAKVVSTVASVLFWTGWAIVRIVVTKNGAGAEPAATGGTLGRPRAVLVRANG